MVYSGCALLQGFITLSYENFPVDFRESWAGLLMLGTWNILFTLSSSKYQGFFVFWCELAHIQVL